MKPVFTLFHREFTKSLDAKGRPRSHFYAAILDASGAPETVLDYQGGQCLGQEDLLHQATSDRIVAFPIEEQAALRFRIMKEALCHLMEIGRFPFYFSGELWVDKEQEVAGQKPVGLWGEEEDHPCDDFQWVIPDPHNPDSWYKREHADGLVRCRLNCVSIIAFLMGVSGIATWPLEEPLAEGTRGYMLRTATRDLFDGHEDTQLIHEQEIRHSVLSDDRAHMRVLKTRCGEGRLAAIRSVKRLNSPVSLWLSALQEQDMLKDAPPLKADRRDVPAYVANEFSRAGLTLGI